jgi:predicted AAA+ superfamily ATPase
LTLNDAVDRLIVVTYEEEKMIEKEGTAIEVIPAYKFTLG